MQHPLPLSERLIALAAAISVDYNYFSPHSQSGGFINPPLFMPIPVPGGGGGAAAGGAAAEGGAATGGAAASTAAGEQQLSGVGWHANSWLLFMPIHVLGGGGGGAAAEGGVAAAASTAAGEQQQGALWQVGSPPLPTQLQLLDALGGRASSLASVPGEEGPWTKQQVGQQWRRRTQMVLC